MKKFLIGVLTFLIVLTAGLWAIIIFGNFDREPSPDGDGLSVSETEVPHVTITPATPSPTPEATAPPATPDVDGDDPDDTDDPDDPIDVPQEWEIRVSSIADRNPDIRRELNAIAERYESVAVSLVVYDYDSGEFLTYQYGMADADEVRSVNADTKFYVASLSKLVTAICVMTLVDEGRIDLDADLGTYFGYSVRNPNFPETVITARMLLNHTSSLFDSGAFRESRDRNSSESVRAIIDRETSFRRRRPGARYEYTNFGYAVLGALCERVSGKHIDALAREIIFEPLGIDAAYVPGNLTDTENVAVLYDSNHRVSRSVEEQLEVPQSSSLGHDLHLAQDNLTISPLDYAKILAMLGNGGEYDGTVILSPNSVNEIHRTVIEGAGFLQGLATRYSVGEFIEDEGHYWHVGSAYGVFSQYNYSLEPNRGVVVVTTGASTERLDNGMMSNCTELARAAWQVFEE